MSEKSKHYNYSAQDDIFSLAKACLHPSMSDVLLLHTEAQTTMHLLDALPDDRLALKWSISTSDSQTASRPSVGAQTPLS